MSKNRIIAGAHYGLRDWIMQRVTAVVMLAYLVAFVVILLCIPHDHEGWRSLFANHAVKVFTLITFIALLLHAWVGVRDLWMDYIKPVGLRLALHVLTILWLLASLIYSVNIIWSV
ncbi:succinate dehydrogenase, hydrophobic membrane anchor protein [Leeia sp. TBRC 13508]|uniref:Succinate dehydrogenase hydrophobic membrane anchor subunit n=1 Tax=Leeia speluncae TaxID=2884804 RepID=A0ABS8D965_9NEIS|nr:succinate dehydrogenase, hydrophobic membrane anchor protein [Leeia speluncae]MCB6184746.1 succinate dehydrogenase, hydrophobic membrane anchor protein [Leeia speluncae]